MDDKVVITHVNLKRYHISGEVRSAFFFQNQECYIWYSIDNWRTFQENSALLMRSAQHVNPTSIHSVEEYYYKFDIEIPMPQSCRKTTSGKSLDRRHADSNLHTGSRSDSIYDDSGYSKYIQFYAVIRNQNLLYLDHDFKVYGGILDEERTSQRDSINVNNLDNDSLQNIDNNSRDHKPLSV